MLGEAASRARSLRHKQSLWQLAARVSKKFIDALVNRCI